VSITGVMLFCTFFVSYDFNYSLLGRRPEKRSRLRTENNTILKSCTLNQGHPAVSDRKTIPLVCRSESLKRQIYTVTEGNSGKLTANTI